jgi:hypothetical protein
LIIGRCWGYVCTGETEEMRVAVNVMVCTETCLKHTFALHMTPIVSLFCSLSYIDSHLLTDDSYSASWPGNLKWFDWLFSVTLYGSAFRIFYSLESFSRPKHFAEPHHCFWFGRIGKGKKGKVGSRICFLLISNKITINITVGLTNQQNSTSYCVLISQCDGWSCFDERINLKSAIMGDSCSLRSASASGINIYLSFVTLYRKNQDSHR